jgi:hypothetical protein
MQISMCRNLINAKNSYCRFAFPWYFFNKASVAPVNRNKKTCPKDRFKFSHNKLIGFYCEGFFLFLSSLEYTEKIIGNRCCIKN